jgi:hypothetical protein
VPSEDSAGHLVTWREAEDLVRYAQPSLAAPWPGGAGTCLTCHGPAWGRARCFQCQLHFECAQGSLADVVVPVALAGKGGPHAMRLWQYKSADRSVAGAGPAPAEVLLALLLRFLRDHGRCVWRAAGFPGGCAATHVAVVPTGRARPGIHPLRTLIAPYLSTPCAPLWARPAAARARDLDPERFRADEVAGARVLLLDDTWTTGASAQSAAMALRRAGAISVATVVLGRHVARRHASGAPFDPRSCAVHAARGDGS